MSGRLLGLAWRNLWRNPRRTLIAMAAIGLGYAMLLFVACLMAGLRQQMIQSGTGLVLSDVEVHAPSYYPDRPPHHTLGGRNGTDVNTLVAAIAADPRVLGGAGGLDIDFACAALVAASAAIFAQGATVARRFARLCAL